MVNPEPELYGLINKAGGLTFLVVDDYGTFRNILRQMVESHSHWSVVAEAPNGLEAVQLALMYHPNVVLMDVVMPMMNGIEAAKRIKQNLLDVCVIMFSAHHEEEFQHRSLQAGADYFILKEEMNETSLERFIRARYATPPPNVNGSALGG